MDKRLCPICSRINQPQDSHCWFCNAELPPVSQGEMQNEDWLSDLQNNVIPGAEELEDMPAEQLEEKIGKDAEGNAPDWLSRIREREASERAEKKASEDRYWAEKKSHDGLPDWLRSLNEDAAENEIKNNDAPMENETEEPVIPSVSAVAPIPSLSSGDDWLDSLKSWQPGEEEIIASQKNEQSLDITHEEIPGQSKSESGVADFESETAQVDSVIDLDKIFSLEEEEPVAEPEHPLEQPQSEKFEAEELKPNPVLYPERYFSFADEEGTPANHKVAKQHEAVNTKTFEASDDTIDEPEKSTDPEHLAQAQNGKELLPFGLPDIPVDMAPIESDAADKANPQLDASNGSLIAEEQILHGASQVENLEPDPDFDLERFFSFDEDKSAAKTEPFPEHPQPGDPKPENLRSESGFETERLFSYGEDKPTSEPEQPLDQSQSGKLDIEEVKPIPDLYPERFFSFAHDDSTPASGRPVKDEPVNTTTFESLDDTFDESEKQLNSESIIQTQSRKEQLPFGLPDIPADMAPMELEGADKTNPLGDNSKDPSPTEEQLLQGASQIENLELEPDFDPERLFSFDEEISTSKNEPLFENPQPGETELKNLHPESGINPEQFFTFGEEGSAAEPEPLIDQSQSGKLEAEEVKPTPDLYPERFFSFTGDESAPTSGRPIQHEPVHTTMFDASDEAFDESEKLVNPESMMQAQNGKEPLPFGLPDIPSDMAPIESEEALKENLPLETSREMPFLESKTEEQPLQSISQIGDPSPFGSIEETFQADSSLVLEQPKSDRAFIDDQDTDIPSTASENAVLSFKSNSDDLTESPFKSDSISLDPFKPDDLPEWLADVKPVEKLEEKPDAPVKPKKTRIIIDDGSPKPEKGKLPVWLASRRPIEALDLSSPTDEKTPAGEKPDLDQSMVGVTAGAPVSALIGKSSGLERGLKISNRQKTNATLLSVIATSVESIEESATTVVTSGTQNLWRSLLALAFIVVAFLGATVLKSNYLHPALFPEEVVRAFNLINSIPMDKPVLIAGDFDAAFAGEIRLTSQSMIEHIMRRDLNIAIIAINPVDAALLTDQINKGLSSIPAYSSANKMVDLGYLPGSAIAVQNMGNSFVEAVPLTAEMVMIGSNEITKNIQNLRDFGAIIVITDKSENARVWIEQIQPTLDGTPLLIISSAQASPLILPYYQSGQVDGLVSGMSGGMIYEQILGSSGGAGRNVASLQFLSVLMTSLVLIGGFVSLVNPKSGRRKRL